MFVHQITIKIRPVGENIKQQSCKYALPGLRAFLGFRISHVGWGDLSGAFQAVCSGPEVHSPCFAARESAEPGPSRSPGRTGAAGHSHLPRPRWSKPEKGRVFSEARRESPTRAPKLLPPQKRCWRVGLPEGLAPACTPSSCLQGRLTVLSEQQSLGK